MTEYYYYCCSLPLGNGSIVQPGNWGRMLKLYRTNIDNSWILVKELIFEQVRRELYPTKPSRFNSIHLCKDEAQIKEFKLSTNRFCDLVYKVELIDAETPKHIGDWKLMDLQNGDNYSAIETKAKLYWDGKDVVKPEVLAISQIKILEKIEV